MSLVPVWRYILTARKFGSALQLQGQYCRHRAQAVLCLTACLHYLKVAEVVGGVSVSVLLNAVKCLEGQKFFSSLGSESCLSTDALEGYLEDLMILAVIVLQAYPRSKFGCEACRGLEAPGDRKSVV